MKLTTTLGGLAAAAAVALAAAGAAFSAAGGVAGCVAGVKTIGGVSARTFCGPAKATVRLNGKTISYRGGECSRSIGLLSVNIGTVVLGNLKSKPEYVGVTAGAKAGRQARQTIAVVHAGKSHAVIGIVTIKAGLRGGSFSGKEFGSSRVVSGSFTC